MVPLSLTSFMLLESLESLICWRRILLFFEFIIPLLTTFRLGFFLSTQVVGIVLIFLVDSVTVFFHCCLFPFPCASFLVSVLFRCVIVPIFDLFYPSLIAPAPGA